MHRHCLTVLAAVIVAASQGQVTYTVNVDSTANQLHVKMEIPDNARGVMLRMPAWGPGSYFLADYWRNARNVQATDGKGAALTVTPKDNGWQLSKSDSASVTYDIPSNPSEGGFQWGGPSTYMYIEDGLKLPCVLKVVSAANWQAYTGLDEVRGQKNVFTAKDYDTLADNPVSIGNIVVDTYRSYGKTHYIVYRGAGIPEINRQKVMAACKFVTDAEGDFFGGSVPYNHYVWHFSTSDSADGGGGLEHLASTQIGLPSGFGRWSQTVLPHEFFHLWNVKRIRSSVLGPFDYTKLPRTGGLWWLEGVTDYYAHMFLQRYGWWGRDEFYKDLESNLRTYTGSPSYKTVSIFNSSFRVGEAANGRGNSQGFGFSYYDAGWVAGAFLDIELRDRTQNRHSLDDVEHALWQMCKDGKPGFQEDEIRKQLVKFGGLGMGDVYDKLIMGTEPKDFDGMLAKVGLRKVQRSVPFGDLGFVASPSLENGLTVRSVPAGASSLVKVNDIIVSIDGRGVGKSRMMQTVAWQQLTERAKPYSNVSLSLKRDGQTVSAVVTPGFGRRTVSAIEEDPGAPLKAVLLREQWLAKRLGIATPWRYD